MSKQIINSIKFAPTETGIIPTAGIAVGRNAVHELHVDQELGQPGPVDDELLRDRGVP